MNLRDLHDDITRIVLQGVHQKEVERFIRQRRETTIDVTHEVVASKPLDPDGDFVRAELKSNFTKP